MKPILQIAPLAILILVAVWAVWRGFRTPPRNGNNRAKGGGPQWKYWD